MTCHVVARKSGRLYTGGFGSTRSSAINVVNILGGIFFLKTQFIAGLYLRAIGLFPMRAKFLQDDNGNESAMRVMCFILLIFSILAASFTLAVWGYISLKTMKFERFDFAGIAGVFGAVGAIAGKALQKRYEQRDYCAGDRDPERSPPREADQ
jgi:hypothetical protein